MCVCVYAALLSKTNNFTDYFEYNENYFQYDALLNNSLFQHLDFEYYTLYYHFE